MEADPVTTAREWFDRFAAGDAGVDLCAPEIRIDNLAEFPITGPYHGHDGVRRWWSDLLDAIDEIRIEPDGLEQLDEERVLTRQRLISVRDGRIVQAVGYASRRQALRAAG